MEKPLRFRRDGCLFRVILAPWIFSCVFYFLLVCKISLFYQAGTRSEEILFDQGWEQLRFANQMDEQFYETKLYMVIWICVN